MTRRELWQMVGAAGAGIITGGLAGVASALPPPYKPKDPKRIAIELPRDAAVGSIVYLLRVSSGWVIVSSEGMRECVKTRYDEPAWRLPEGVV